MAHWGTARASTVTVWGFPLGVTADEFRKDVGEPHRVLEAPRQMTPLSAIGASVFQQPPSKTWQYLRDGRTFDVRFVAGIASSISLVPAFGVNLGDSTSAPPADPLGIRLGDTMGDLLIKSRAVDHINPGTEVQVLSAIISVSRDDVRYTYVIAQGLISSESVYYAAK